MSHVNNNLRTSIAGNVQVFRGGQEFSFYLGFQNNLSEAFLFTSTQVRGPIIPQNN